MTAGSFGHGCKPVDPCCQPISPVAPVISPVGTGTNRYAFVLVLFILLVIVGAAFWF